MRAMEKGPGLKHSEHHVLLCYGYLLGVLKGIYKGFYKGTIIEHVGLVHIMWVEGLGFRV